MGLTELDLIRTAAVNPKFLSAALVEKTMHKAWSGFTKLIRTYIGQGQSVICPQLGRLIYSQIDSLTFLPCPALLSRGQFNYRGPASLYAEDHVPKLTQIQLSYSSVAAVCALDKETVHRALQELVYQAVTAATQGREVHLNLKVGTLKLMKGWVEFHPNFNRTKVQGTLANINEFHKAQGPVQKVSARVCHELPLTKTELALNQKQQIHQHNIRKALTFKAKQQEDKKYLEEVEKTTLDLALKEAHRKRQAKVEFLSENKRLLEEKQKVEQAQQQQKLAEQYTFFPFTNGDQVEARTKALLLNRRDEEQRLLRIDKPASPGFHWENHSLPKFMVPNNQPRLPRPNKTVMKDAFDRHFKSIEARRVELNKQSREQHHKLHRESLADHEKDRLQRKNLAELGKFLQQQMKSQHARKVSESAPPGYYGPEGEDYRQYIKNKQAKQRKARDTLISQMQVKHHQQVLQKSEDLIHELETNKLYLLTGKADEQKERETSKKAQTAYKEALDKQVQLKALERGVLRH